MSNPVTPNRCEAAWELFQNADVLTSTVTPLLSVDFPSPEVRGFQGGCSDGVRYYYLATMHYDLVTAHKETYAVIGKIDLWERRVVKWSAPLYLDHANDIAYDPATRLLAVCHCKPNGERLTLLDSETLEILRDVELPFSVYSIDYCPAREQYAVGLTATRNFRYLDRDFNPIDDRVIRGSSELLRYTKQGVGVDDRLLYFILWDGKHKAEPDFQNVISVYDWEGKWRGVIEFDVGPHEPECISVVSGELVAVCVAPDGRPCLYRIEPKAK